MLSRATQTPQTLARLDAAIDELKCSGEFRRIADSYALPVLINQTLDSNWFRIMAFVGTVAFALSGVRLAYEAVIGCSGRSSSPHFRQSAVASFAIYCCSANQSASCELPRRS